MAQQSESSVQLQTDTLTSAGNPVRMLLSGAMVTAGTAPVFTTQQVVSLADGQGAVIDTFYDNSALMRDALIELREIRRLVSLYMGIPYVPVDVPAHSQQATGI